jgi:hypothetical protein
LFFSNLVRVAGVWAAVVAEEREAAEVELVKESVLACPASRKKRRKSPPPRDEEQQTSPPQAHERRVQPKTAKNSQKAVFHYFWDSFFIRNEKNKWKERGKAYKPLVCNRAFKTIITKTLRGLKWCRMMVALATAAAAAGAGAAAGAAAGAGAATSFSQNGEVEQEKSRMQCAKSGSQHGRSRRKGSKP